MDHRRGPATWRIRGDACGQRPTFSSQPFSIAVIQDGLQLRQRRLGKLGDRDDRGVALEPAELGLHLFGSPRDFDSGGGSPHLRPRLFVLRLAREQHVRQHHRRRLVRRVVRDDGVVGVPDRAVGQAVGAHRFREGSVLDGNAELRRLVAEEERDLAVREELLKRGDRRGIGLALAPQGGLEIVQDLPGLCADRIELLLIEVAQEVIDPARGVVEHMPHEHRAAEVRRWPDR